MTNNDRLTNMSIEEKTSVIYKLAKNYCHYSENCTGCIIMELGMKIPECSGKAIAKWLKREVDNG